MNSRAGGVNSVNLLDDSDEGDYSHQNKRTRYPPTSSVSNNNRTAVSNLPTSFKSAAQQTSNLFKKPASISPFASTPSAKTHNQAQWGFYDENDDDDDDFGFKAAPKAPLSLYSHPPLPNGASTSTSSSSSSPLPLLKLDSGHHSEQGTRPTMEV